MIRGELIQQLIRHEGMRLKPYKCPAGKLTIGVGRNLDDKGISKEEANYLLYHDIYECELKLVQTFDWFLIMNMIRQDAIINMCFNLGLEGLLKFKKMIKALEEKNYEEAAKHALDSAWVSQVGDRAVELAEQIRTGKRRE